MQIVFYRIKYMNNDVIKCYDTDNINEAIKFYNMISNSPGISNIKFFIVNNVEEELTKDQLPKLK